GAETPGPRVTEEQAADGVAATGDHGCGQAGACDDAARGRGAEYVTVGGAGVGVGVLDTDHAGVRVGPDGGREALYGGGSRLEVRQADRGVQDAVARSEEHTSELQSREKL